MKKQEHTLTLRVPKDIILRLRKIAEDNYCSVSDVARDMLSSGIYDDGQEHVFSCEESWKKAVLTRDAGQCVRCSAVADVDVYALVVPEQGGTYTLSNGTTLCFECYLEQSPLDVFAENGHRLYLPQSWIRKYRQAREQGRIFWERHLACFLTRRKRALSPIVEWYAETFLRDVPEEVIIQTLVELCPSPDIIAEFPSRRYTSTSETFKPPPLKWNSKEQNGP